MRRFPVLAILLLTSCVAPPPAVPPAPPPVAAPVVMPAPGQWLPACVNIDIRVFRDGPLARLGHDHLVTASALSGSISVGAAMEDTRFEFSMPWSALVVDDPAARARIGGIFAAPVPEADREATRSNLLGPAMLDAAQFPVLELRSVRVVPWRVGYVATLEASIRGSWRPLEMWLTIEPEGSYWRVDTIASLTHTQLGLVPFSVAMGALRVHEEMNLRLNFLAVPVAQDLAQVQCGGTAGTPP